MLTTVAKVKGSLSIPDDDGSLDNQISFLIAAASSAIEQYCNRSFRLQSHAETVGGTGTHYVLVRNYPILEMDEVVAPSGVITDYQVLDNGILYRKQGWLCFACRCYRAGASDIAGGH
jgi:hypothetical protein